MSAPTEQPPAWPAVVVVAFALVWAVVGVRGLVVDDSRFAWGMFPYTLETTIEPIRFLDEGGALVRTWRPPTKPPLQRFLRPGEPRTYGYAAGAYVDLVEHHLLPRAALDAPPSAASVSTTITLTRSERDPVKRVITIPITDELRARGARARAARASSLSSPTSPSTLATPKKKSASSMQTTSPTTSVDDDGSP